MRIYLLLVLIVWGLIGCVSSNLTLKEDNNRTKKVLIIDLDREIQKDDYSKGGLRGDADKIISIDIGDNDEVSLKGDVLKKADSIKIGDNDEVAFSGTEYTIKTTKLKDGVTITIKYGKGKEIKMRVRVQ